MKKTRNVVTPDTVDRKALVAALESQGNVIPAVIATVLRLAAPIIARLAIRYVARTYRKKITDAAVRAGGEHVGNIVQRIIDAALEETEAKRTNSQTK